MRSFVVLEMRRLTESHSTGITTIWFLKRYENIEAVEAKRDKQSAHLSTVDSHVVL